METNESTLKVIASIIKRYDILQAKIDSTKNPSPKNNTKRLKDVK